MAISQTTPSARHRRPGRTDLSKSARWRGRGKFCRLGKSRNLAKPGRPCTTLAPAATVPALPPPRRSPTGAVQ